MAYCGIICGIYDTVLDLVSLDPVMWVGLVISILVTSLVSCISPRKSRRKGIIRIGHTDGSTPEFVHFPCGRFADFSDTKALRELSQDPSISSFMVFSR